MKIIVPMAGRGSRLRPHTLTVPKPLIPIAGKPIVQRLVENIAEVLQDEIEEIAFVIGKDFGEKVEQDLLDIAKSLGSRGKIYYQDKPLGTGHAIMCAEDSLTGPAVIAYADTLFRADFTLDKEADGVIWVKQVENPAAYGVVQLNDHNEIIDLVEKPEKFVSDLAVIGIYYFKEVSQLRDELRKVLDQQVLRGGEYQINDGIAAMKRRNLKFVPGQVAHWMDCGNKRVTVETNSRMLGFLQQEGAELVSSDVALEDSKIIAPCYIGKNVSISGSTIGPNVSVGDGCKISNSRISDSLIQTFAEIQNADLKMAMIGNFARFNGNFSQISIGDYSVLE